ncbi:MAG: alpha/beta fold hydrolase [Burkholderiales bacterium]
MKKMLEANCTGRSVFHSVRGISYHVREWGGQEARKFFLLHGWMDVSASFEFLVQSLRHEWHVIAPDWRGFGLSGWAQDGYWFTDYLGDLDALLEIYSPQASINLVGHSLGGIVACVYAGIRPERAAGVVSLEGFGLPGIAPDAIPPRLGRWLEELKDSPSFKTYRSFDEVALRLRKNNPRLAEDRARFLARHWAKEVEPGNIVLAADPKHKRISPIPYRREDAIACWKRATARVLWISGEDSHIREWLAETDEEYAGRTSAFSSFTERQIANAGHMLHHDQPEEVARIIEEFLLERR